MKTVRKISEIKAAYATYKVLNESLYVCPKCEVPVRLKDIERCETCGKFICLNCSYLNTKKLNCPCYCSPICKDKDKEKS